MLFKKYILIVDKYNQLKGNCLRFRQLLEGEIQYDMPNFNINQFNGYLNLKTDPKKEFINFKNVIFRSSTLHFTRW